MDFKKHGPENHGLKNPGLKRCLINKFLKNYDTKKMALKFF